MTEQIKHLRTSKHGKKFVAGSRPIEELEDEQEEMNILDNQEQEEGIEDEQVKEVDDETLPLDVEISKEKDNEIQIKFIKSKEN